MKPQQNLFLLSRTDKIGFIFLGIGIIGFFYDMAYPYTLPSYLLIPTIILCFLGSFLTLRFIMTDSDNEQQNLQEKK